MTEVHMPRYLAGQAMPSCAAAPAAWHCQLPLAPQGRTHQDVSKRERRASMHMQQCQVPPACLRNSHLYTLALQEIDSAAEDGSAEEPTTPSQPRRMWPAAARLQHAAAQRDHAARRKAWSCCVVHYFANIKKSFHSQTPAAPKECKTLGMHMPCQPGSAARSVRRRGPSWHRHGRNVTSTLC